MILGSRGVHGVRALGSVSERVAHLPGRLASSASPRRRKLGHSPVEHLRTYAHVVLDRSEIDLDNVLARERVVIPR